MVLTRGERRASRRFLHFKRIQFIPLSRPEHLTEDKPRQGYIVNICKDGFRMQIRGELLNKGSFITVRIPVTEKKITVPALAEIRWVKEQKTGDYQVGLRYITV